MGYCKVRCLDFGIKMWECRKKAAQLLKSMSRLTDRQEKKDCMINLAFTCSLDLYKISIFFVNQTFSIMNKPFFEVKKSCGSA